MIHIFGIYICMSEKFKNEKLQQLTQATNVVPTVYLYLKRNEPPMQNLLLWLSFLDISILKSPDV